MIILGLDNAGKSTILLTMKKQLSVQCFAEIAPTKGIATENLETDDAIYYIWDFGGQDIYREDYLNKSDNFKGTDVLIYVIDIQDPSRYDAALQYLEKILEIMKDLEQNCEYSVFFHKFDPDILESKDYQKKSADLRAKLRTLFKKYGAPVKVYHTSVYTVFQRIQVM